MKKEVWIGVEEGALLGLVAAAGVIALGWDWACGVLWGVGAVAAGRLVWCLSLESFLHRERTRSWLGLVGFSRQLLVAAVAFAGIGFGMSPIAIAIGLFLTTVGLWVRLLIRRPKPC